MDGATATGLGGIGLGIASLAFAWRAFRVAERQTALAEQQVELAERASRPNLWIQPRYPDTEEGTGNPMGADHGDTFGFSMDVGNDGGAAVRGVTFDAYIDGKAVAPGIPGGVTIMAGEFLDRPIHFYIPSEHVREVRGRGAPVLNGLLSFRAHGEHPPCEAWWPPDTRSVALELAE